MPLLDITRIALPTIVGALALGACSQATTAGSVGDTHTESTVLVTDPGSSASAPSASVFAFRYNSDVGAAETTLDVPLEVAWMRVTRAYDVLKIPVTDADKSRLIVGPRRALVRDRLAGERMSHWVSCGETAMGTPRADAYTVYLTALTQLVPGRDGAGYTARTVVSAFANATDASSNSVQCSSTGALEQKLSDEFRRGL